MGAQIMVCGANRSGKSLFAERLVSRTEGRRYYIATMINFTEDNAFHIRKHRLQREGLNFTTFELPFEPGKAEIEPDSVVLLEDVSNLLANLIFEKSLGAEEALEEINALREKCALLIMVSISGLSTEGYEGETAEYINALNEMNSKLFRLADAVIEMENRRPVLKKGDVPDALKSILDSHVNI